MCSNSVSFLIGILHRLVGGSSYNEGRVEVYYNYQWGTVCDDGWDDTDAGVVCRQLGFGSSGIAIGSAGFGPGSGSVWLNSVTCTGSEHVLASCGHLGVGITSGCYHYEDAGVRCNNGMYIISFTSCYQKNKLILWYRMCASFNFQLTTIAVIMAS